MKILSVTPVFPPLWNFGGTATTGFAVIRGLAGQGQEVFALTTAARKQSGADVPLSQDTVWEGVPVRYCRLWGRGAPFWSPELRQEVRRQSQNTDIALIRSCWTYVGGAASQECRKARVPYLAYPEGSLDPWTLRYSHWKKMAWWRLREHTYFQRAAAIVALTAGERDHIRQMGLTNRIEVIPNGINLSDLSSAASREELEAVWCTLRDRRWLLFLGRLHPKKGLDLLIPAFARIAKQFPDHLLVIAGPDEGGYAKEVQRLSRESAVASRILLTGPISGAVKLGLLKEADIFVLTSYSEGLPMAVLEALGCGVPVLLTQACNMPEVVEAGAGLEVSPSVEAIALTLTELLGDDELLEEMGRKGRHLVASRFTWDIVARQTLALCADVLGCL